jgi:hypothetical protein
MISCCASAGKNCSHKRPLSDQKMNENSSRNNSVNLASFADISPSLDGQKAAKIMDYLKATLIVASIAAMLFSAPMAEAAGRGGGGVPAGTAVPTYGAAWAAEQQKSHNPSSFKVDSGHSKTGHTDATTTKGG